MAALARAQARKVLPVPVAHTMPRWWWLRTQVQSARPRIWARSSPRWRRKSGFASRAWGRRRLASLLVQEHRLEPYDVIYQFSTIEVFGLRRHWSQLPPLVIHPETHIAGELRCIRRERHLASLCEPLLSVGTSPAARSGRRPTVNCSSTVSRRRLPAESGSTRMPAVASSGTTPMSGWTNGPICDR
jgi:hypothetical protein